MDVETRVRLIIGDLIVQKAASDAKIEDLEARLKMAEPKAPEPKFKKPDQ